MVNDELSALLPKWEGHELEVSKIASLFNNVTNSYKYVWFLSLLDEIEHGKSCVEMNDVLLNMIAKSYAPCITFHIQYGKQDKLPDYVIGLNKLFTEELAHLYQLTCDKQPDPCLPFPFASLFKKDKLKLWVKPLMSASKNNLEAYYPYYQELIKREILGVYHKVESVQSAQDNWEQVDNNYPLLAAMISEPETKSALNESPKDLALERLTSEYGRNVFIGFINALYYLAQQIVDLKRHVPYRLLSPWIGSKDSLAKSLDNQALYCLLSSDDLALKTILDESKETSDSHTDLKVLLPKTRFKKSYVLFNPQWITYLQSHNYVLRTFTLYHFARYLERMNLLMPAIISKLDMRSERLSLAKQHDYFNLYIEDSAEPLKSIYTGENIGLDKRYALDHFIPWSFVYHNFIWNLSPVEPKLNSSKLDHLPKLDPCLERLANMHQKVLQFHFERSLSIQKNKGNGKGSAILSDGSDMQTLSDFNEITCDFLDRSHGKSLFELTRMSSDEFCELIFSDLKTEYLAAKNQGFTDWDYAIS